nr:hypothetical protein [Candidatus Bandiella numerosa]
MSMFEIEMEPHSLLMSINSGVDESGSYWVMFARVTLLKVHESN